MNKVIIIILVLVLIIIGFFMLNSKSKIGNTTQPNVNDNEVTVADLEDPKKAAHYESNTPEHAEVIPAVPINVVINFNFDLSSKSDIKILDKSGIDYGIGITSVDDNKLSLRRDMNPDSPDGIYQVDYNACWPDNTCHDGSFSFVIDKTKATGYEDLTGQENVEIVLKNSSFSPVNIRVSRGTNISWINNDNLTHYVNSDSHPAHTYFPDQNSKELNLNDRFDLVFLKPGWYPYHCSAHEAIMTGNIIVE